jgi:anthranilate phosphoribosyltransferase
LNVQLIWSILEGKKDPTTDIALLNAGAALIVGGQAETLEQGMDIGRRVVESGASEVEPLD